MGAYEIGYFIGYIFGYIFGWIEGHLLELGILLLIIIALRVFFGFKKGKKEEKPKEDVTTKP